MEEFSTPVAVAVERRFSTAELQKRYGLKSRTTLITRIQKLDIETYREGNSVYVSEDSVLTLDALNECLKRPKAKLEECVAQIKNMQNGFSTSSQISLLEPTKTPQLLQLLPPPPDLVAESEKNRRFLREAAEHGDVLTTSEVLDLLGLRSLPRMQNNMFTRRGFVFVKQRSDQRQSEWVVGRLAS